MKNKIYSLQQKQAALAFLGVLLLVSLGCSMSGSWERDAASQAAITEVAQYNQERTETAIAAEIDLPTQDAQPTYTYYPTYTELPEPTDTQEPAEEESVVEEEGRTQEDQSVSPVEPEEEGLSAEIEVSGDEFYCNYDPNSITFRLDVNDINTGFALYYNLEDVASGLETDTVIVDIHRDSTETFRFLELIGDPAIVPDYHGATVVGAPGAGPAYLVYEIIADDGSFRSEKKSDITYYPCGYVIP